MQKIINIIMLIGTVTVMRSNSDIITFPTTNQNYVSAYSDNNSLMSSNNVNNGIGNNGNNGNNGDNDRDNGYCAAVPEPATTVGLMGGAVGLFVLFRKKMLCKKSKN
jgi:hypothetical protein